MLHLYRTSTGVYWGTYGYVPQYRNVIDTTFRSKPVELDRWYITKHYAFQLTIKKDGPMFITSIRHSDGHVERATLPKYRYIMFSPTLATYIDDRKQHYDNFFNNRRKEYRDRYFMGMFKRLDRLR